MSDANLEVLEAFERLAGTDVDIYNGWFLPINISAITGLNAEEASDELDVLLSSGLVEARNSPGRYRLSRLAKLSVAGAALLAANRIRVRTAQKLARSATTQSPIPHDTKGGVRDVFLSYASEDRPFVLKLRSALDAASVSVWMDVDELLLGMDIIEGIEWGMARSRHGLLLVSPHYLRKPYPRTELNVLLKRQIEAHDGTVVLPLLHDGVSQQELNTFSSILGTLRNVTTDQPIAIVVSEILRVVRPPSVRVDQPVGMVGVAGDQRLGAPEDALPDDVRLVAFMPRLNLQGFGLNQVSPNDVTLAYVVQNNGKGTASKVSTFLPLLVNERLPSPIVEQSGLERQTKLSALRASVEPLPAFAQVVVEFEDVAGNLYRQYGKVSQNATEGRILTYSVEELDKPYLVPRRIIPETNGSEFRIR